MINLNEIKDKTILVTGGAGFIGSHLCDRLLELGGKVICFDNFFTGKKENIAHNLGNANFIFTEGDANKYENLSAVFHGNKINYVFHYAAVLGVKRVEENPLIVLPDIIGIENILKLSRECGVKKVIFSSSSEAYGNSDVLPLHEDREREINDSQGNNVHLYALVKLIGEKMINIYTDKYGLPTCSLRFFNVFGPRQESSAYGFVIGVFIKQIINNEVPTIFGDGYQTRDFIFIKDNVELAIITLLNPATNGEIINIGLGRQTTILELAEKLIRISGKALKPKFLPPRKYEIRYRSPDVSKMHRLLGKIEDKLEENLKATYEYYKGMQ
ncbi:NAD-dependent epimerase/dehydratase family protein [Candidatus Falkowbacteria bacterium]|nr:NAD-dependent epimerase/dehydratase family protein [Candidatus Falkowbacteria bacterium]